MKCNVKTFGSDRARISVILCISPNSYKALPLLIFKGKKGGKKEINIQKNIHVQKRKIYVLCQGNSWGDSEMFHYWLDKILFNNIHINNNLKKILILDNVTSH